MKKKEKLKKLNSTSLIVDLKNNFERITPISLIDSNNPTSTDKFTSTFTYGFWGDKDFWGHPMPTYRIDGNPDQGGYGGNCGGSGAVQTHTGMQIG